MGGPDLLDRLHRLLDPLAEPPALTAGDLEQAAGFDAVVLAGERVPPTGVPDGGPPCLVLGEGGIPLGELTGPWLMRALAWEAERAELQGRLRNSNRRAEEMLATVSHELRSPMTVISMAVQLAQNPATPPEKRERHLKLLGESVQALHTLLNDILDYSKLDSGRLELSEVDFGLRALLENVAQGYGLVCERKGLDFDFKVPPDVPDALRGDPGRLRQVLVNLLGNACKFTDKGSVSLAASPLARDGDTVELQFTVRDSGIGIAPAAQARIFDAYVQADKDISRKFGGTGLGLAITRRLVELMGGRIWVESRLGGGSAFHFTCRLARQPAALAREDLAPVSLSGLRALVADRNRASSEELLAILADLGLQPEAVSTASQAAKLASPDFGVAFLDLDLGRASGFDLLDQFHTKGLLEHMPVLVTTSAGQRGDAARCVELGASAYLTRPLAPGDVRTALEAVLADHRAGRKRLVTRHTLREELAATR